MQDSPEIKLELTTPEDPEVLGLYDAFIREADGPLEYEVDIEAEIAAGPSAELVAPNGVLLLARVDGAPAGIGGVRHLDTDVAEVKSMFVSPTHRGIGLGRRLLAELEQTAIRHGCGAARLDTSDYLTEAIGLYRAAGYREVPAYNSNPKASLWFERALD
jgi:GNAT superfamily N-acetyltransferase